MHGSQTKDNLHMESLLHYGRVLAWEQVTIIRNIAKRQIKLKANRIAQSLRTLGQHLD